MSEIKYTTDGKKVVVIGNLNSVEKIVQEIFVIDGSEIPSGEHFVVKSLHDAPAVSWKEKNEKEIEQRYSQKKFEIEAAEQKLRQRQRQLEERFSYLGKVINKVSSKSFELITGLLTGTIKYIVIPNYTPNLLKFEDFNMDNSDGMRLVSLFGRDDGTLNFYLGYYSDGSGGKERFIPFTNYEEAFEKFNELVKSASINKELILLAKEHNITLDSVKVAEWKDAQAKWWLKNKIEYENRALEFANFINELETL